MQVFQGGFCQRLWKKWGRRLMLFVLILVVLAVVGWFALYLLVVSHVDRPLPYAELKSQAEIAVREAGGCDVLGMEAKAILSAFRAGLYDRYTDVENDASTYPATVKLYSLLSANYLWLVADKEGLPAHVVIRFGSHARYAYVWILDPADVPLEKVEGVEHLGGAVYLSHKND